METDRITAAERLIVALDFSTWSEAEKMVHMLPDVKFFKVGLELYLATGGKAIERLKELGKEVFLDLKFHDIPNTASQAVRQGVRQGARIVNVHAAGGKEMMKKCREATSEQADILGIEKPLLIAVTVLTSLNEEDLSMMGLQGVQNTVSTLANLAKEVDLDGVVASPQDISLIRKTCGRSFKIICPGIRPAWAALGDQKRVMTPKEAILAGADYLVIGRPITRNENPNEAACKILEEIGEVLG